MSTKFQQIVVNSLSPSVRASQNFHASLLRFVEIYVQKHEHTKKSL